MTSFMRVIGACSFAFLGMSAPAFSVTLGPNLIVNGDFETVDGRLGVTTGGSDGQALNALAGNSGGASWDVYADLPGWTSPSGNGIEVQTNGTLGSIDSLPSFSNAPGSHYIELDSERTRSLPNSNSSMAQTLTLDSGEYQFSFWYSPRRNSGGDDNLIRYDIVGSPAIDPDPLTGDISGPLNGTGTTVGVWTEFTALFRVLADDTQVSFTFSADGNENEHGGLIDNVAVQALIPVPAPLLLIASAFGIAAGVRRATRPA